jgi:hypothetical protein
VQKNPPRSSNHWKRNCNDITKSNGVRYYHLPFTTTYATNIERPIKKNQQIATPLSFCSRGSKVHFSYVKKKMNRVAILAMYRELLARIRFLDPMKQPSALLQVRTEFKKGKTETDPTKINALLEEADKRLRFLRIMTPRAVRGFDQNASQRSFIFQEGEVVEGTSVKEKGRFFIDKRLEANPDHYERHKKLLKRQFFGQEPPKNPFGPF